ncbi:MAG: class I SAM-dependent methyltransferase [Hydrogenophaga sp.]|uniref:class I SAM-dependent methyltransferase n=1 Tax=Hydrogenophaga sp. TaxID=1904254 RepID=UPI00261959C9|nr:class I SAM-dependent methyltransferase [Hydrogenophaga sp.]MCV0439784.1 class I SAM-dependent methyltransferase [Hydrogenophaga sp.]
MTVKGYNKFKDSPDDHDFMTEEHIAGFLRNHKTGIDNFGRHTLAQIVAQYKGCTVVDAACGTCVNWDVFKRVGVDCNYIGIDRTQGMLAEAKKRYGDEITLQEGYVQELPLDDGEVDVVIMRHIVEHLQEGYEDAVREGLRVASKELVLVFFLDPSDDAEDVIQESQPDANGCTHFWNTYSWPKFTEFVAGLGVQMKVGHVATPGAAHADTIVRLIK